VRHDTLQAGDAVKVAELERELRRVQSDAYGAIAEAEQRLDKYGVVDQVSAALFKLGWCEGELLAIVHRLDLIIEGVKRTRRGRRA
jgi:hypothetical protein